MAKYICDFCNTLTDDEFIYKLYTKKRQGNTITTEHIYICEMDFEAIKSYDDELDIYYLERSDANYYFYNDLDLITEYGFNTNCL